MRLPVEKITEISTVYAVTLAVEDLNTQLEESQRSLACRFVRDATINFRLSRCERRLLLAGDVSTEVNLQCGRCLAQFVESLHVPFSLALTLEEVVAERQEELELDEEQINVIPLLDGEVDLDPILLEQVLVCLPVYPVCRKICAGLCPYCGVDLNKEQCQCEAMPFNNRFGKLKNL